MEQSFIISHFYSSTAQKAGSAAENPVPTTAEVDPHAAATSCPCTFDPSDLGTIPSPSSLSDKQKYQNLSAIPATLQEYQSTVKNGVINHNGLSSFLGFGILPH